VYVKNPIGLNLKKTNDNKKIIYCDFSDFEKVTVYSFFDPIFEKERIYNHLISGC